MLCWSRELTPQTKFILHSPGSGRVLPIYSIQLISGKLWCVPFGRPLSPNRSCATGNTLTLLDPETMTVAMRLPSLAESAPHHRRLRTTPSAEYACAVAV